MGVGACAHGTKATPPPPPLRRSGGADIPPKVFTPLKEVSMTEQDRIKFQEGLSTPLDKIVDTPFDSLLKARKRAHGSGVKVIPTSDEYRDNYPRIFGHD